jgi:uncharacterized membrane protein HdeD (DUF308 family)
MCSRDPSPAASVTLVVAMYLAAKGLLEAAIAFKLRSLPGTGWLLFDGMLTVAIRTMIAAASPASTGWAVGVSVGVALFSSGMARLSIAVRRVLA